MKPTGGNMVFAIRVVLVLALALGLSAPLAAQIQNGTFSGVVTDQTGAVVPGAEVKVTNLGTSFTVMVKTDGNGLYRATELPVGTYKIEVSAAGFKKAVHTNLALNAGTTQRVDLQLALGQATEVITVEGGAPLVNTEDSRLYETVSRGQVANMPLNGRNVFDLIQLAPGAVNVTGIDFENGHQFFARHRVRVPAQRHFGLQRILPQRGKGQEATAAVQPIRRHRHWPRHKRPCVFQRVLPGGALRDQRPADHDSGGIARMA